MKCNVCATETRCYQLREVLGHPGMMMHREGMIFCICASCLAKLVAAIKTDATAIETPEAVPMSPRVEQLLARGFSGRANPIEPPKETK